MKYINNPLFLLKNTNRQHHPSSPARSWAQPPPSLLIPNPNQIRTCQVSGSVRCSKTKQPIPPGDILNQIAKFPITISGTRVPSIQYRKQAISLNVDAWNAAKKQILSGGLTGNLESQLDFSFRYWQRWCIIVESSFPFSRGDKGREVGCSLRVQRERKPQCSLACIRIQVKNSAHQGFICLVFFLREITNLLSLTTNITSEVGCGSFRLSNLNISQSVSFAPAEGVSFHIA